MNGRHRSLLAVVALALTAAPVAAGPVILDFESLRHVDNDFIVHGPEYVEDGFRFLATHQNPGNSHRLNTLGTLHPAFPGSTALYQGVGGGDITLTEANVRPFNLLSIQLAEQPNLDADSKPINSGPFDVVFTGHRADGTTVTNTITVDGFLTLTTYTFSGFNNLTSVKWAQGSPTHQFDNVTVQAVPGPGGLVLIVAGLPVAAVLFLRSRGEPLVMLLRAEGGEAREGGPTGDA